MYVGLWLLVSCAACASAGGDLAPPPPDGGLGGGPSVDAASETGEAGDTDAAVPAPSVAIGVPGGPDGLEFAALAEGAEIRLQSFGQGGTHVLLAIRCIGFGNRAYVALTLINELTSAQVMSPAPPRPQLLLCRADPSTCDLVPILAMTGGLTAPGVERDGLPVRMVAEVHNDQGLRASATHDFVLSTADL